MERMRLGIVGCGSMGKSHARAIAELDLIEVVAVADAIEQNAAELAAITATKRVFGDYRELLALDDVQGILVSVPNFLHKEVAVAAMRAGKDVLCEKPMALTVRDCDAMLAAAESTGRKLMVGHVLRLMPPFIDIRRLISEGRLGRPLVAVINRMVGNPAFSARALTDHWRRSKEFTGGLLHEVNVHEFDLLRSIFGDAAQVYAKSANLLHPGLDYDDFDSVIIDFRNGASATLLASNVGPMRNVSGTFICEKGQISYTWDRDSTAQYQLYSEEEPREIPRGDGFLTGIAAEDSMFAKWVLTGEKPEITGWDGRQAIAIVESAYRSAKTGRPAKVK